MQSVKLRRDAHLIADPDFRLGRDAGDSEAIGADTRLQQDFRTELLDDFDAGIQTRAGGAIAQGEIFGPDAHDQLLAVVGLERPGFRWIYRNLQALTFDGHAVGIAAHGNV